MAEAKKPKLQSESYKESFLQAFPKITSYVREQTSSAETGEAMKHFLECLEYTVPGGKLNRGLMVIGSLKHLTSVSPEMEDEAFTLGWCVELLQACFLVADDIMDKSPTRRGKPCWYLKDGVGLVAINDALWLESYIYELLKKTIRSKPYYLSIVELFQEVSHLTKVGQCLDTITAPEDDVDLNRFSLEKHAAIVKYKTAFYSFYLPVGLAMFMAGYDSPELHQAAKDILLVMGEYFQVQDDFLDCFGDPEVTGKIGTDIEDNKCSWLIVQALARTTPVQRSILEANYGRKEAHFVAQVKTVYRELSLQQVYQEYEQSSYEKLAAMISKLDCLPQSLFTEFCNRIFKRNK